MARVIQFYARDLFLPKGKSVPRDRRGKVIQFPKEKRTVVGKTAKMRERDQGDPMVPSWPVCF
jgi:hypothetical protein